MSQTVEIYQSYLLRVWRPRQAGTLPVRLVLTSTSTGAEWHFANLASLIAFLEDPAPGPPDAASPSSTPLHP